MSSDIIVCRATSSSREKSVMLHAKPFKDICDRVFGIASALGNRELAELVKWAKLDGYLDLHGMDGKSLTLLKQAISEALADPSFFAWQAGFQQDPIYDAQCQKWGTTPLDDSIRVREITTNELLRLIGMLREAG